MKGFGEKLYHAELKTVDLFEIGIDFQVCFVKDMPFIETRSAAKAVQKTIQHLHDWLNINQVDLVKCQSGTKKFFAISDTDFVNFLESERQVDNPYAEQIMSRSVKHGIQHYIAQARASGKDYIETPFGNIRFTENGYVSLDDMAKVLDVPVEEMLETIKSEDFQRYYNSFEGWE